MWWNNKNKTRSNFHFTKICFQLLVAFHTCWHHIDSILVKENGCPRLTPIQTMAWHRMGIGIDHDTACAGVVGTAIRHSTSCAGRRAAACGRHNECCARLQYQPRQGRPYMWSISIIPLSQFYKKQGKLAFSTSCTTVRPHRRFRDDALRRDS